ncbi:Bipartite response regulator, C-terminal effector [Niallia circulans]|jgi:hypothetical protein|nr:Bipartite response regulator, C-terminal effector [Niallia circulans]
MKEKIEQLIRDYHWMSNEVDRLQKALYGYARPMRSWGVALYGDEAGMPRGSSGKSQIELQQMDIREERLYNRLQKYQKYVMAIEMAGDLLENEKEKIIYDCLLDGMSYRVIGNHLGISKEQVRRLKSNILCQMCQMCHFSTLLNKEKSAV